MILNGREFRKEINFIENYTPSKKRADEIVDDIEQKILDNKLKGRCVYTISREDMIKHRKEIEDEIQHRFTYLHTGFQFISLTSIIGEAQFIIEW